MQDEPPPVNGSPHVLTAQWVLPVSRPPIENGYVAFENGKILAVGKIDERPGVLPPKPGSLITPGLVNCHVHLEQSFPQRIPKAADEPFTQWLLNVVALIKQHASPEEKAARCRQGVQELLQMGTTCANDIASGPESMAEMAKAGLRGFVSLEAFHPAVKPLELSHWVDAYRQFKHRSDSYPLLTAGLSPHSPYNVSPAAWQALLEACQPPILHTHVAEFADEGRYLQGHPSAIPALHQAILNRQFAPQALATSPVSYLSQFHLLTEETIVAHAIETDAEDRQQLTKAGVGIVHCPRSNLALHGKTLRAEDWDSLPIAIGLGTDGRLSTEDLDLRAEARCAMRMHNWSAAHALATLTWQGARVLKMEQTIGSLEPGKQADLVVWQADGSCITKPEDWVLAPTTLTEQVFIAGEPCYQRRYD